jgi:hypothetical protein
MRLPGRNRPVGATTILPPQDHKGQCCVIKREPQPTHGSACVSLDLGLNSCGFPSQRGYFRPHRKNLSTPDRGMRADLFVANIPARSGRRAGRSLFRHAKRLAGNSWSLSRLGFEVLVKSCLKCNWVNGPISSVPARPPADARELFISISLAHYLWRISVFGAAARRDKRPSWADAPAPDQ